MRRSSLRIVVLLLAVVFGVGAASARANELIVESRRIRTSELLTVIVSVEGAFATVDGVDLRLENLAVTGQRTSSEFSWINGQIVRRKVFRYTLRSLHTGAARVGPVIIETEDGQRDMLAGVDVQVVGDPATTSNDPEMILRELDATGRPPLFVVPHVSKRSVFVGEQVVVTWFLYNAARVEQWHLADAARLPEFWSEEIDIRRARAERVYVGGRLLERMPMRKLAVYPLRSGTLTIGPVTIEAEVLERHRGGPFWGFEASMVDATFTSAAVSLDVAPVPEGPPVDVVGSLTLRCSMPAQENRGPVVMTVALAGRGNIRSSPAPRFDEPVAGRVQVEGGEVTVAAAEDHVTALRKWRYLIFPEQSGVLEVPPLSLRIFDPAAGERREIRCAAGSVDAIASEGAPRIAPASPASAAPERPPLVWIAVAAAAALLAAFAVPMLQRNFDLRRQVRQITAGATASEIRQRIEERLGSSAAAILVEASDRGDAWRALRSMLTAAERDRDIAVDADDEIARRVRELLVRLRERPSTRAR